MINFKLDQGNFNHLKTQYKITPINQGTFIHTYQLIFDSIRYFKDEIEWSEMFDFVDVQRRISDGQIMYVGMIDCDVFGYVWFKDYQDGRLLFNLFVRNKVVNKNYTGKEFISDVIYRYEYDKSIYCEVDDWNEKSIKLFKRLGFNFEKK
jgi:hypothetical protein